MCGYFGGGCALGRHRHWCCVWGRGNLLERPGADGIASGGLNSSRALDVVHVRAEPMTTPRGRRRSGAARLAAALLTATVALADLGLRQAWVRADDVPVPIQPTDPVAAKAYGVFDQACAGCHQLGKLKNGRMPAGALGNILDLATLARNPGLVAPGNADASPLYTSMQGRTMPLETGAETSASEITATELGAVRDWIEQLPATAGCSERARISAKVVAETVKKAVQALAPARAATTRYISLVPLSNDCATAPEIEGARQAVVLLLNSLSLALEPMQPRMLDGGGPILEFDLASIGWTLATWDHLAKRSPNAPFVPFDAATRAATATDVPLVNGDWLAEVATRAPLYYDLLGLPDQLPQLLASLRIDPNDHKRGVAERLGIRTSAVGRGNRLIERRTFANGAAWFAHEFAPTAGRPDMFDMMMAAATSARQTTPVTGDATLVHFDLPNGFPAYFAANPSGMRINDVPLSMLKDDAHPTSKVAVAQSCLRCHGAVPVAIARGRTDDLKARISAEAGLTKDTRDRLLALHPEPAELPRKIDEDRARFLRVATAAGIDPSLHVAGLELLPALVERYRRDLTAAQVADLADIDPKALMALGTGASAALADVIERLSFGTVPRTEVDAVFGDLALRLGLQTTAAQTSVTVDPAIPAVAIEAQAALPMRLVLKADRAQFQAGDLLTITTRTNAGCHLTVLTVNAQGRGTVLFPNEFEPNTFIEAGRDVRVPGDKAPYQFRLRDKGRETLIATCTTSAKPVDGIHHDFEKQRFTELGDYRAFLNRNWGLRQPGDTKSKPKPARKPGESPAAPAAATVEAVKTENQARAAIRISVE